MRCFSWLGFFVALVCLGGGRGSAFAQLPPGATPKVPDGLEILRWAREPMLRSPVALSFDDQGHLYVVETARRSTVDIDIRGHPAWLVEDLANQSIDDLRAFFRRRMAPELSAENASWLRDLNEDGSHDWRDLTMVKEKVHRLTDARGRGTADQATVFAEGFNEEVNGVIAGVLPWGDDVFVTVYPDLWRLRDRDGDGVADERESLFRGFGVHAAFDGHDLHGLTVGPEGKIYFSIGDNGFSVTNREGRRLHHPNTGGVLRMNPDGSDLEVFALGLRNPQEIAFDDFGNWFTVDNDGDLADERERFVHIAEGSDSGWRLHWQFREAGWANYTHQPNYNPWIDERMWVPHFSGQPAHLTPPLTNYSVGPGSFKFNPGTALNEAYRGHFFLIQFPVAKVTAFQARPRGAGFEMVNEHVFLSGMMASAVNFGPDGALYVGDWDGMWSPSGRGSVWKIDDPAAAASAVRSEVREQLRKGFRDVASADLERWLGHADQRLRLRAQFEAVRRGEFGRLRRVAASSASPLLARVHALWGLGQGRAVRGPEDLPFRDAEPELRAQAAKVAGDARVATTAPMLVALTADPSSRVRYHAALALGKLGVTNAFPALVDLLAANADEDPFLRHAGVMGFVGCAAPRQLASLAHHPSTAVRLAAVVALRRLGAEEVRGFLDDAEAPVWREAVRAIHDDTGIAAAWPALASRVTETRIRAEPGMMRRALNANLLLGTDEGLSRLGAVALDIAVTAELRLEALECLAAWSRSPALDRVQGFVRSLGPRSAEAGNRWIREHWEVLTRGADQVFLQTLARIVMENHLAVDPAVFAAWAVDPGLPAEVRVQAVTLLGTQEPARLRPLLPALLADPSRAVRLVALPRLAELEPAEFLRSWNPRWERAELPERQLACRLLATMTGAESAGLVGRLLDDLIAGRSQPELALDVLDLARRRPEADVRERLALFETREAKAPTPLAERVLQTGGDAGRGAEIFRGHPNAQCVRCHDAGGEGQQAGPVLRGIGARVTADYLVEALVRPSARIADGFATTAVTMRNGDEWDGVRISETATELVLRQATGAVRRLPRAEIAHQATSEVSAMPPMGEVLTPFQIRDLVAFLAAWKN